ncbi:MAG: C15orf41 family protein [Methanohalobium sp.]|uniref:C15orf41 family protein n=1 Tax=Methanohalobium sp. TaxID=2837493 RepID=UPI00397C0D79
MEKKRYQHIYESIDIFDDVEELAEKFMEPVGVISSILSQKTVSKVKKTQPRVQKNIHKHLKEWEKGYTIQEIAKRNKLPESLMATILLKEMGYSKKQIFSNPDTLSKPRLKKEIKEVIESDYHYSPKAHKMQSIRGQMGEDIIEKWLIHNKLDYYTEDDLRDYGHTKTPDFVLNDTLIIEGLDIQWIESKALFGDEREHKHYFKKQFKQYEEKFGQGMVVYWYGFLENIDLQNHIIKDYEFFYNHKLVEDVDKLLSFSIQW